MKRKRKQELIPAEQKAKSMLERYGFKDALVQIEQVICFIDINDMKTKKYWDRVLELVRNPNISTAKENQL